MGFKVLDTENGGIIISSSEVLWKSGQKAGFRGK